MATMLRGVALVQEGCLASEQDKVQEGIIQARQGMVAYRATGAGLDYPHCLILLARGYQETGQAEAGLHVLTEALAVIHSSGECYYEAEAYRLKGELLLQSAIVDEQQAEACFRQALDVAGRQQARGMELRAAMSLSRLWQRQGKRDEARQLLAEVYGWFTEGLQTIDLQEAQVLLEGLT
jgi:predicted ATPase